MARITVEDCLHNIKNRFILVRMASLRTRQLLKGSTPLVYTPENREVVQSLREIAAGKVNLTEENITRFKDLDILDSGK
jgi:DNA-directed RNA polymerase subunit omega